MQHNGLYRNVIHVLTNGGSYSRELDSSSLSGSGEGFVQERLGKQVAETDATRRRPLVLYFFGENPGGSVQAIWKLVSQLNSGRS